MIEEKYIEKFYNILWDNYQDKALLYKKATSYINGVIKNGGKVNELIYSNYTDKKHFNQDSAVFHPKFTQNNTFIELDLFKFMETKGMLVISHKFLYPFHYSPDILSHINEHYIHTPLDKKDKEAFYDAFICAVKFGTIEVLPFYFTSKGKDIFFENEEKLINNLSYYLYWHSFDDKNEEAVAFVINQYYRQKNKDLLSQIAEKYCLIAQEKQGSFDDYNQKVLEKINVIVEQDRFNQKFSTAKNKNTLKI